MTDFLITISLKNKAMGTGSINGKCICKDGATFTIYSDRTHTMRTYNSMKKAGEKVEFIDGTIVFYKEGKTSEELLKEQLEEIEQMKTHFKAIMDLKYSVREIHTD